MTIAYVAVAIATILANAGMAIAAITAELKTFAPYDLTVRFTAYSGLRRAEVAGPNIGDVGVKRRTWRPTPTRTTRITRCGPVACRRGEEGPNAGSNVVPLRSTG